VGELFKVLALFKVYFALFKVYVGEGLVEGIEVPSYRGRGSRIAQ